MKLNFSDRLFLSDILMNQDKVNARFMKNLSGQCTAEYKQLESCINSLILYKLYYYMY